MSRSAAVLESALLAEMTEAGVDGDAAVGEPELPIQQLMAAAAEAFVTLPVTRCRYVVSALR